MRDSSESDTGEPHITEPHQLTTYIQRYQHCAQALVLGREPTEQAERLYEMSECLTHIAEILEPALLREARRWRRSRAFGEVLESVRLSEGREAAETGFARHLFTHVLEALSSVRVDPTKNVIGLLVMIARHGMAAEERYIYKPLHLRRGTSAPPTFVRLSVARDDGKDLDLRDTQSEQTLERVVERDARAQQLQAVLALLRDGELPPSDRHITQRRLLTDPPLSYAEIAGELGSGWTEAAVRQRMKRLRDRLREQVPYDDSQTASRETPNESERHQ